MQNWANLPAGLLADLYQYLPRRDRLSCFLVCSNWREALNHGMLWRTMIIHLDIDLMEPSTIHLLRCYCKYLKHLELGWGIACTSQILPKELAKRTVRLLLTLCDNYVQVHSLRMFNWFDFGSVPAKIIYHLLRFIQTQLSLQRVVFDNISLQSTSYNKVLARCLCCRSTITYLDIKTCYIQQLGFEPVLFKSCIEQLSWLRVLKIDYYVLSCRLMESILGSGNRVLEELEVVLQETDRVISEAKWREFCGVFPSLRVGFVIRNVYHHKDLQLYLKISIPTSFLSIMIPEVFSPGHRTIGNFRKVVGLIVKNYGNTLESLDIQLASDHEQLDDSILMIAKKCPKLRLFVFRGLVQRLEVLRMGWPEIVVLDRGVQVKEFSGLCSRWVHLVLQKKKNGNFECSVMIIN